MAPPNPNQVESEEQKRLRLQKEAQAPAVNQNSNIQTSSSPAVAAPTSQQIAQQTSQQRGASGAANWSNRFNANKAAAENTANQFQAQAAANAHKAEIALNDSKDQFNTNLANGSVQGVGNVGSNTNNTAYQNSTAQSTPAPLTDTEIANQYDSFNTPNSNSQALMQTPDGSLTADQMKALSQQSYSGPRSIADSSNFADATAKAQAAQDNLNALGSAGGLQQLTKQSNMGQGSSGGNALSAALTGSAGGGAFDQLRSRFTPQNDLNKAVDESSKTAAQAKIDSAKNADDWAKAAGVQLDKDTKQAAFEQAQAKAKQANLDQQSKDRMSTVPVDSKDFGNPMFGIDTKNPKEVKARMDEVAAFSNANYHTDNDSANNAFEDFNSVMSPINWVTNAAGVRDPGQDYETKNAHGGSGIASGGTNGRNIDWTKIPGSFFVWRQMTPQDWQVLNKKPRNGNNGQSAWIQTKLQQLTMDQRAKNAANSAPKTQSVSQ